jgi:hypothetical protein
MSEQREPYLSSTAPIGEIQYTQFAMQQWEIDYILQTRQAAREGKLVVCDPDARCWWTTGKQQCSRADRDLPFKM